MNTKTLVTLEIIDGNGKSLTRSFGESPVSPDELKKMKGEFNSDFKRLDDKIAKKGDHTVNLSAFETDESGKSKTVPLHNQKTDAEGAYTILEHVATCDLRQQRRKLLEKIRNN